MTRAMASEYLIAWKMMAETNYMSRQKKKFSGPVKHPLHIYKGNFASDIREPPDLLIYLSKRVS